MLALCNEDKKADEKFNQPMGRGFHRLLMRRRKPAGTKQPIKQE